MGGRIYKPTVRRVKIYYAIDMPALAYCRTPLPMRTREKMTIVDIPTPEAYELERRGEKAAAMRPIYGEAWQVLREKASECGGKVRFIRAEVMPVTRSWYISDNDFEPVHYDCDLEDTEDE